MPTNPVDRLSRLILRGPVLAMIANAPPVLDTAIDRTSTTISFSTLYSLRNTQCSRCQDGLLRTIPRVCPITRPEERPSVAVNLMSIQEVTLVNITTLNLLDPLQPLLLRLAMQALLDTTTRLIQNAHHGAMHIKPAMTTRSSTFNMRLVRAFPGVNQLEAAQQCQVLSRFFSLHPISTWPP